MQVGTKVTWKSQSAGKLSEKVGEIVAVIPGDKFPTQVLDEHVLAEEYAVEFDFVRSLIGKPRGHESYLVAVDRGPKRKKGLYWPRVSHLKVAEHA